MIGTAPQTTAQGVKIDQRKVPPTASAASSGQIDGSGEVSRTSGRASATVETRSSRTSTRSPVATGSASRSAQSGSAWVTTGMRAKL